MQIHPSTKKLIDRLYDMTLERKIEWKQGADGAVVYETERYCVTLAGAPTEVILSSDTGAELDKADHQELTNTLLDDGTTYAEYVGRLHKEAHRFARGAETAIDDVLASLDLEGDAVPDTPAPDDTHDDDQAAEPNIVAEAVVSEPSLDDITSEDVADAVAIMAKDVNGAHDAAAVERGATEATEAPMPEPVDEPPVDEPVVTETPTAEPELTPEATPETTPEITPEPVVAAEPEPTEQRPNPFTTSVLTGGVLGLGAYNGARRAPPETPPSNPEPAAASPAVSDTAPEPADEAPDEITPPLAKDAETLAAPALPPLAPAAQEPEQPAPRIGGYTPSPFSTVATSTEPIQPLITEPVSAPKESPLTQALGSVEAAVEEAVPSEPETPAVPEASVPDMPALTVPPVPFAPSVDAAPEQPIEDASNLQDQLRSTFADMPAIAPGDPTAAAAAAKLAEEGLGVEEQKIANLVDSITETVEDTPVPGAPSVSVPSGIGIAATADELREAAADTAQHVAAPVQKPAETPGEDLKSRSLGVIDESGEVIRPADAEQPPAASVTPDAPTDPETPPEPPKPPTKRFNPWR